MSGNSLPYHLRTNKSIDRKIFFDLLSHLSSILPSKIQEYKYISMGGPMLEDHHILHHEYGMTNLLSIERDKGTLSRQVYNRPYGCIRCEQNTTREYINNFNEVDPVIIWLDYTDTKWATQFQECESLLNNLKEYDILKVTFNANPDVLKDSTKNKIDLFKEKANYHLISENLTENDVQTMPNFAKTICDIFQTITQNSLGDYDLIFYPLLQFRYIDNRHQMFTITGIVLSESNTFIKSYHDYVVDASWDYNHNEWGDINEINVPILTQQERYAINQLLPKLDGGDLNSLPFILDKNKEKSERMVRNYIKYYRYIPTFQQTLT
ncbi:O-methyltransferase [Pectobacterium polonicum]|uniref:O-methyltransferase n=1 Tax=Pectobacterium polonicum TaxID=2485124 RepID=A0ABV1PA98_9GAMM|nr:O-methyltransferase [Pectobacterium polonicum]MDC9818696.1 hypothetical protein [Pectobacterium polonicum]